MIKMIDAVAIVGGTHGNEFTGPHLLRRWHNNEKEITRSSFTTDLYLGNPKAFLENRRFIDEDLNRCFSKDVLHDHESVSFEATRAAVLNSVIGPKDNPKHDFIIDLHTSTSNCGVMIILLSDDAFSLRLAAYLSIKIPQARIHYIPVGEGDHPFLSSITPHSLGVEIGPIPQGLLRYDIFELSKSVVLNALDFAHARNSGHALVVPNEIEVFKFKESISFPGEGAYTDAMIHESLQDNDYMPLHPGAPLFRKLDGSVVSYEGSDTVYPVFINEAAYYYKRIAMSLTTKETLIVPISDGY